MFLKKTLAASTVLMLALGAAAPAHASIEPFIGQIQPTAFTFCPRGFAPASGQLLSIAQNTALFSLLGTTYGGNGSTNFALPNLNGRMPIGVGTLAGVKQYVDGEVAGSTSIQLTAANLPSHTHSARLRAFSGAGNNSFPVRNTFATAPAGADIYSTATPTAAMRAGNINVVAAGQGQAIANVSPYTVIKYCIALQGIFPSRN